MSSCSAHFCSNTVWPNLLPNLRLNAFPVAPKLKRKASTVLVFFRINGTLKQVTLRKKEKNMTCIWGPQNQPGNATFYSFHQLAGET